MAKIDIKQSASTRADSVDSITIDSREPRASRIALRLDAGHYPVLEVDYEMPEFDISLDKAVIRCVGTKLGEDEERAVLAFLAEKYRE